MRTDFQNKGLAGTPMTRHEREVRLARLGIRLLCGDPADPPALWAQCRTCGATWDPSKRAGDRYICPRGCNRPDVR